VATPHASLYAEAISGAHRLPNGNTIIDDGTHGTFYEVTAGGDVVWKYISPVVATGPLVQGEEIPDDPARAGEKMNAVFRVYKYQTDYPAFAGRTLTPGDFVERYPTAVDDDAGEIPSAFALDQNFPNPFNPTTVIRYRLPGGEGGASTVRRVSLRVYDLLGREVADLVDADQGPGQYSVTFDATRLPSGIYLCRITAGRLSQTVKMTLTK
jgi:hypothetical protein